MSEEKGVPGVDRAPTEAEFVKAIAVLEAEGKHEQANLYRLIVKFGPALERHLDEREGKR